MATSSKNILRVIQISDCHLSELPHTLYRGEDGEGHLHHLIDRVIEWQPDLLLATGDLSEDASKASYSRLAACLDSIDAPVLALPGNHDDPAVMQHFFPDGPWNGPLVTDFDSWRFILLNSKKPCGIEGTLSSAMLDGLSCALEARPDTPALVALHHQPVLVGAHWIDRYALQQPQHAAWACQVILNFRHSFGLRAREIKRQLVYDLPSNAAITFDDAPGLGFETGAHQAECKLAGK